MTRRNFGAKLGAAFAGVAAASAAVSTAYAKDKPAKHVCKGMNECKGQGGGPKNAAGKNECKGHGECATTAKHDCKGKNECKGQGGGEMAGKNECKGHGDCAVPLKKKASLRMRANNGSNA
jgi:hypothetical protein